MRFAILVAAVALFTVPQDLGLLSRDLDADHHRGLGAKRVGESREDKAGIDNEGAGSYESEKAAIRAYPGDSIPAEATSNAQAAFQSFRRGHRSVGQWTPIGPLKKALYPAVLDVFLFDGAPYVASGRVTAWRSRPPATRVAAGSTSARRAAASG